ncbi:tetratricopeptide repeat protein [Streptacidiphilus sp. 4-A2]|nr:tetratricopeptide repeat protein [Streptacidiphilus sp. 4-A2]
MQQSGDVEAAVPCFRESLELARAAGLRHVELAAWHSLGGAELELGRTGPAVEHLLTGLELAEELGDHQHWAEIAWLLARAYTARQLPRQARRYLRESLALMTALKHPKEGAVRQELARVGGSD